MSSSFMSRTVRRVLFLWLCAWAAVTAPGCGGGGSGLAAPGGVPAVSGLVVSQSAQYALGGTVAGTSLAGTSARLTFFTDGTFLLSGITGSSQAVVASGSAALSADGSRVLSGALLRAGGTSLAGVAGSLSADGSTLALGALTGQRSGLLGNTALSVRSAGYYRYQQRCPGLPDTTGNVYLVFDTDGTFDYASLEDRTLCAVSGSGLWQQQGAVVTAQIEFASSSCDGGLTILQGTGAGSLDFSRFAFQLVQAGGASCLQDALVQMTTKVDFGYSGELGPEHWADLSPFFFQCGTGTRQSPIDLPAAGGSNLANIEFDYERIPMKILNNGHTVEVEYEPGSSVTIDGVAYGLLQFHFHTPSEHATAGATFPAELHLVHRGAGGTLAVVGVLLREGSDNAAYAPIVGNLPATAGQTLQPAGVQIDAEELLPSRRLYYNYDGSLTTPPCTEGVRWYVLDQPVDLAPAQLSALRGVLRDNHRPRQPLNGRIVRRDITE